MVRTSSSCGSACRTYMVRWSGEPDTSSTATRMQNSATSSRGYGRGSGRRSDEGSMVEMVTCGILVWGSMCYVHPYGRTEWTLTRETVIIDLPELL